MIKQAKALAAESRYDESLELLNKAENLKVNSQAEVIRRLEKEVKKLKKGPSLWSKFVGKVGDLTNDLLKEE